jgi:hypothetical protein
MTSQVAPRATRRLTRALAVLAIIGLAVPAGAGARAVSEVQVTHDRAVVGGFDVCSGEEVFGAEGHFTRVTRETTDASGGVHTASISTAVGASRDGVIINHQADAGPTNVTSNGTATNTDVIQVLIIEPGSEDDSLLHVNHHTTLTDEGEVVANPVNVNEDCHG